MAETVSELLVKLRSEGVDETTEALADQSEQFEETAETADEQSGKLDNFADRWEGAMGAIVAGLTVAAAGLASQVPVLGEVFAGLQAIIQAVAFQMDQVLRPILQPVTEALFGLANSIATAEGAVGDFFGVIGTIITILGAAAGAIAAYGVAVGGASGAVAALSGAVSTVASVLGTIGAVIAGVVGGISALAAAAVLAVAAVVAFAAAYLTNFMGVRDKTNAFVSDIINAIVSIGTEGIKAAKAFLGGIETWLGQAVSRVSDFIGGIRSFFTDLIDDAAEWGRSLVQRFVQAIEERLSGAGGLVGAAGDVITGGGGGGGGVGQTINQFVEGGGGGGTQSPQSQSLQVFLEGRQASRATSRYRNDETNRRGRYG